VTISSTENRVAYTGNGSTVAFSFPYAFLSTADLVVVETVIATGVQTIKALGTDYTVSGTADANGNYPDGATVTAVSAPAATVTWTIYRDPAITQPVDLVDGDPLPAASIEVPMDRLTMIAQRSRELTTRALRQPDGDSVTINTLPAKVDRASKYLAFDANGDPIASDGPTGNSSIPVSSFMETVLDDADAATARATLGAAKAPTHGANIASAATVDLDSATGDLVDVTGTTTITAITLAEGGWRTVRFTGALTLTHGASLVLPGAANITTAAGDFAIFRGYGSSVVRCVSYVRAAVAPITSSAFSKSFTSSQQTITSAGALTLAHGMGVAPSLLQIRAVCQSAEGGFSVGDEVLIDGGQQYDGTNTRGMALTVDATNVTIRFGTSAAALAVLRKDTGAIFGLTNGSWKLVVRAWA
jgi:hypothetical protein